MDSFKKLGLDSRILDAISEMGFVDPMPIQAKVIPYLLEENISDIIALAQTGTGKTAAFGLPVIQRTDVSKKHTQHLVLCPTRELCIQITNDIANFSKYTDKFKIVAVYGGASIDKQVTQIRKGVHVIVATPGRLLDLIHRNVIDLSLIKTVVLDEADEMLDMGFRDDLEEILNETPSDKKTLLFSATMPKAVLNIANRYMNSPVELSVGKRNAGADTVTHIFYTVHAKDRYLALKRIADYYPEVYGIVFCRTRQETKDIADKLIQDGYNADALHGDLSQGQRDAVMNKFRIRHLRLLVATDVAARGLDVDDLTHIINYNLPDDLEVYTHRSGRTGRAGKKGVSIIIANLKESTKIKEIERQINKKFTHMPVPTGKDICEKQLLHLIDRMKNVSVDDTQIESFLPQINTKLEDLDRDELIKKFVSLEFNRFSDYYKNAEDLNTPEKERKGERERGRKGSVGFTRFFLNLGHLDNIKPTTVIGMIKDYSGVKDIEIGQIEILKSFSFFETDSEYDDIILKGFSKQKYNDRTINAEVAEGKPKSGGDRGGKDGGRSGGGFRGRRDGNRGDRDGSRGGGYRGGRDGGRGGRDSSRGEKDGSNSERAKDFKRNSKSNERQGSFAVKKERVEDRNAKKGKNKYKK